MTDDAPLGRRSPGLSQSSSRPKPVEILGAETPRRAEEAPAADPPARPAPIERSAPERAFAERSPEDGPRASDPPSPQDAPPPPDAGPTRAAPGAPAAPRADLWARLAIGALGALAAAGIALSLHDLAVDLLERSPWLGAAALALIALAVLALLVLAVRELAALGRLKRIDALRAVAERARASEDVRDARATAAALERLYGARAEFRGIWRRLRDLAQDAADAGPRLDVYERELMGPLDAQAEAEIARHSRHVATATALAPSALLDAAAALFFNLRMIRRVARIYGGRAGALGSWRLAKRVVAHAMAAGLIALGDDLLEPLLGGGAASRLSRRVGEGVVNGAMTARIGAAAMEICRPLPFHARRKPRLRDLAWSAVSGSGRA